MVRLSLLTLCASAAVFALFTVQRSVQTRAIGNLTRRRNKNPPNASRRGADDVEAGRAAAAFGRMGPLVIGAESVHSYLWSSQPDGRVRAERTKGAISGLYSTGTNAIFLNAEANCKGRILWQVRTGKHWAPGWTCPQCTNASYLEPFKKWWEDMNGGNVSDVTVKRRAHMQPLVPVVTVRHPIPWLFKSMCRRGYDVTADRSRRGNGRSSVLEMPDRVCPNGLAQNRVKRVEDMGLANRRPVCANPSVPKFPPDIDVPCKITFQYDSIIDLWNDFYSTWLEKHVRNDPVIFVRHEDGLLHPHSTIQAVCHALSNTTAARGEHKVVERNAKETKDGSAVSGHIPLETENGTYATRSYYAELLSDPAYLYSDSANRPLNRSLVMNVASKINRTLMEFFGYALPM